MPSRINYKQLQTKCIWPIYHKMGKFLCCKHFHECGGLKKRISNNVQTLDSFYVFNDPAFPILMQTERPKTYRIKVD